jgi:hypothetical protein
MKRYVLVLVLLSVVFFSVVSLVSAEEVKEEKISTTIVLKNDWVFRNSGQSSDVQRMSTYWGYKSFGGGFDLSYARKDGYIQVNPYLTLNKGPWFLVGGFSFDNFSQYVQFGFWYLNRFGDFDVFVDIRNYFAVGGKAEGYLDNFIEITRPLGERFYAGLDLEYIHWWGAGHDWYFIGPLVGYRITKTISTFVRISHEWDILGSRIKEANCIRLGLTFKF